MSVQREGMIRDQIQNRGVTDQNVLSAMSQVDRTLFVPRNLRDQSYQDSPLPIGEGQTISQPYIVALMTALAGVERHEKVLEIGTGSGYQTAVLAEMCDHVYSIEIIQALHERAAELLSQQGYDRVETECRDGFAGWQENAPFDVIIVTCAPPRVPPPLLDQLAEGGRLVIPEGKFWQELKVYRKEKDKITSRSDISVRFVPMTGRAEQ